MDNNNAPETEVKNTLQEFFSDAVQVITAPAEYYKAMPKTGGYTRPLLFIVVMGVAVSLIQLVLSIFSIGMFGGFLMSIVGIIFIPLMMGIFSFIAAAIYFIIWKLLGSKEDFETAYRCTSSFAAIMPVTTLFAAIPYVGNLIPIAWMLFLLVLCSVEIHKIQRNTAWIVFGILAALLALFSLSSEHTSRKFAGSMEGFAKKMEGVEEMTPEEMGRAMGEFMKGMEKEMGDLEKKE